MPVINRRRLLAAAALTPLTSALAPRLAHAAYPERPIRIVSPYTAGGLAEAIMRLFAPTIEQKLGQKLVIEAKPGAAGNIGTQEVARAEPDGYTILIAATNNFVINQFLLKMSFDPLTTLAPIARAADVPLVLFSNPEVPARTLGEFIAQAKANPGKLSYGVPSLGTVNHLLMERLKQATGADITAIPFRGSPEAALALLKNDIQLFPIGLSVGTGHLREGKLTALAVASERRLPTLPDVPTIAEAGFPGFNASNWWGIAAPAGTPENILDTLANAIADAQKSQIVVERFPAMGLLTQPLTRSQFATSLKPEAEGWKQTIERGKIAIQ